MPVLSFYEGFYDMSFAVFDNALDANDNTTFSFPYTYSYNLFANSFTKEKFYRDVFKLASKELNVDFGAYDLYSTGILAAPTDVPIKSKDYVSLLDNLTSDCIFISTHIIATKDNVFGFTPRNRSITENERSSIDLAFRANLDLYHNIVYTEPRDILLKDSLLREIAKDTNYTFDQSTYVVTGDRLLEFELNKPLTYLLIFDIIKTPGAFYLKLDTKNLYAHTFKLPFKSIDYASIGTLVNAPGAAEVLYETDIDTKKIIKVEKDKIFIIPSEPGSISRVVVEHKYGTFDKKVKGGDLGIIIDTRDKQQELVFSEVYVNNINESLIHF